MNSCNNSSWIQHPSITFSLLVFEKRIEFLNQYGPLYVYPEICNCVRKGHISMGLLGYSSVHHASHKIQSLALGLPGSHMKKSNFSRKESESESHSVVPTLCNPMDCTVHGILQARILEWLAFPFSRGSSQRRDRTQVSHIAGGFITSWATREAQEYWSG